MEEDELAIQQVLQQAPAEATYDDVKRVYYKLCRDIPKAVAELWNLPPLPEKSKKTGVNADKWDEVRKICDEFDAAATRALGDAIKQNRQMREEQEKAPTVSIEEYITPAK